MVGRGTAGAVGIGAPVGVRMVLHAGRVAARRGKKVAQIVGRRAQGAQGAEAKE